MPFPEEIDTSGKNPVFCMMPWVHFHVTQYGTVTPCCQAPWQEEAAFGNINRQTIKEIWQGEKINAFRAGLLAGRADVRCESCFARERSGMKSLRQITNKNYRHKLAQLTGPDHEPALPVYFDIRFSNVCNLKCRICGPWSSSGWYNDALKLGMISDTSDPLTYSVKNNEKFFEQFGELVTSLEELYFAGGEPLVMEEHYRILNLLIERKRTDVKLVYNTNFSSVVFKQYDLFDAWKKFSNVNLSASLDASGRRGEFLRKNLVWSEVEKNRRKIREELPHIEFAVTPTLNIYNLLHLPDFHKDWVNKGLIMVEDFIPSLLVKPRELSVNILPQAFKHKARMKYMEHVEWIRVQPVKNDEKKEYMLAQFESIINCLEMPSSGDELELFHRSSRAMDKIRNEKTPDVFPELAELF